MALDAEAREAVIAAVELVLELRGLQLEIDRKVLARALRQLHDEATEKPKKPAATPASDDGGTDGG